MMNRRSFALIGVIALIGGVSLAAPARPAPAKNAPAATGPIQMRLVAEKKILTQDGLGKFKVTWWPLGQKASVQPGEIIRYTVNGENSGEKPVSGLAITQPIPQGTKFELATATLDPGHPARVIYSIDRGKTFVEKPTIRVTLPDGKVETRPAPAEAYTHVRWILASNVTTEKPVKVSYQVRVR
jgi:uncharacterized repeat protein (TIGR01451 family)